MSEFDHVVLVAKEPTSAAQNEPRPTLVVQTKLRVGAATDPLELEADRVAAVVVAGLSTSTARGGESTADAGRVQRSRHTPEAPPSARGRSHVHKSGRAPPSIDRMSSTPSSRIQPKSPVPVGRDGGTVDRDTESRISRSCARGSPIEEGIRRSMERGFGSDFARVRVHTDANADQLNRQLQAQAFTTGRDIFFRKGEYQPDSIQGQHLLAHELTHVVQQCGTTGETVQRSLGLEFETGWHLIHEMPSKYPGQPPVEVPYPKETSILGDRTVATGWSMETDGRDIEFVVEPPFDESAAGMVRLGTVMAALRVITNQLDALSHLARLTPATHPAFFRAGWLDPAAVIVPNGDVLKAQPQATAGVRLDRMEELFIEMQRQGDQSDLSSSQGTDYFANRAGDAAGAAAAAPAVNGAPASDELKGFITLVTQYVQQGDQEGRRAYAKDIAYAMARTDFAHMFSLLPEQVYFQANPLQFVNYVLTTAGFGGSGAERVIKQRIADGQDTYTMDQMQLANLPRLPLTRGQWLHDISQGTDRLTQAATINMMAYTDVKGGNRLRATGLLGATTDAVGGNGLAGVIVELRQMKRAIPATNWADVARGLLTYMTVLNDHNTNKAAAGQAHYGRI